MCRCHGPRSGRGGRGMWSSCAGSRSAPSTCRPPCGHGRRCSRRNRRARGRSPRAGDRAVRPARPPRGRSRSRSARCPRSARPVDRQRVAVLQPLEEVGAGDVDEPHAGAGEQERARVGIAPVRGVRDIDDRSDAGGDQLLGGDAVDVRVVDDRDVGRPEAPDEALRLLPQAAVPWIASREPTPLRRASRPPRRRLALATRPG